MDPKNIDKTYIKYKLELDAVDKYINNTFIYDIFYNYGFKINNTIVPLDSNINVYEACFISQLVKIYIDTYKEKSALNILEIGFARGTSCLIIMNQVLKYKYLKGYDIIDPYQTAHWKDIGVTNVNNFLHFMDKKLNYKLHQESSTTAVQKLRKKYDISFIDGSHEGYIVIQDIMNSDKKLCINGLIIIDDVLHKGVKDAILEFVKTNKNYKRISINNNNKFITEKILYDTNSKKKSFNNPSTMFCFQKIK